ncbi:MAG: ATP-binding cassette domain-containing protein [Gemmatimonadaceae bacterium]
MTDSARTSSVLELSNITKRYGALVALDNASLVVRQGTVHAVLGENGAGKTTLMRVAYGMVRPDRGVIRIRGREVKLVAPLDAIATGVGMVHQHFTLVPAMTVQENLALGGRGRLRARDMTARVREIAQRTGFALDPFARVDSLPVGAQQRVEIAKAMGRDASLLILDEPTAVLAPAEVEDLLRWLRAYVDAGHAVVLITHKLREALAVADDVTVLRHGRVVHSGLAHDASPEQLTEAMIGATNAEDRGTVAPIPATSPVIFTADHISVDDRSGRTRVREASFVIRRGELVGIAAVEGAGQRELLRALSGRYAISSGRLARPSIVGFVPEDRQHDAVLLERSLTESVALRGAGRRRGRIDWLTMRTHTTKLLHAFDVRALHTEDAVRALSGGNQQKLVLARELAASPDEVAPEALVVENPTRGLDVRATADVHRRLREACARGAAVVMYSSDLDEVLGLATRVLVLFDGTVREMPIDRDVIGRAMLGSV